MKSSEKSSGRNPTLGKSRLIAPVCRFTINHAWRARPMIYHQARGPQQFCPRYLCQGRLFRRGGAQLGSSLVGANLTGHDSHGVVRVPRYLQWLAERRFRCRPEVEVRRRHAVDGGGRRAIRLWPVDGEAGRRLGHRTGQSTWARTRLPYATAATSGGSANGRRWRPRQVSYRRITSTRPRHCLLRRSVRSTGVFRRRLMRAVCRARVATAFDPRFCNLRGGRRQSAGCKPGRQGAA